VGAQDAAGGAGMKVDFGGDLAGDPGRAVEREPGQVVALAGQGDEEVLLAWLAVSAPPGLPGCGRLVGGEGVERGGWRRGGCGAAGGDGAFLDDPAAEPGQRAGRGEGQAQQPQQRGAGDGERGGVVSGEVLAGGLHAGQGPGADDADEGVAGQGVDGGGHHPDGGVPPAAPGGHRVHRQGQADAGDVQRAWP